MKSQHVVRERRVARGAAGLIAALLLAPLLALMSSGAAQAVDTLCLPGPDAACIAGTIRTEDGPLADVRLTVTDQAGTVTAPGY